MKLLNNHLDRADRLLTEAEQHLEVARVAAEVTLQKMRTAVFELQRASMEGKDGH